MLVGTDYAAMFPMLLRGEAVLTNDTYFIQRYMARPALAAKPTSQDRWALFKTFFRYFCDQVEQSDLRPATKAIMKTVALMYTHKKIQGLTKIARNRLIGR